MCKTLEDEVSAGLLREEEAKLKKVKMMEEGVKLERQLSELQETCQSQAQTIERMKRQIDSQQLELEQSKNTLQVIDSKCLTLTKSGRDLLEQNTAL